MRTFVFRNNQMTGTLDLEFAYYPECLEFDFSNNYFSEVKLPVKGKRLISEVQKVSKYLNFDMNFS